MEASGITINSIPTGSGGIIRQGKEIVDIGVSYYTINHDTINPETDIPLVSLTIPTSSSVIYDTSITERTSGSFDVQLSGTPSITGYEINWCINSSGNGYIVKEFGVQQTTATIVTPNLALKDVYEITLSDTTETTINPPVSMSEGQSLVLIIKQGGVIGNGTVDFHSSYKFPGNVTFVATSGSNMADLLSVVKVNGILFTSSAQEYFI
jgi:hypothetical protein